MPRHNNILNLKRERKIVVNIQRVVVANGIVGVVVVKVVMKSTVEKEHKHTKKRSKHSHRDRDDKDKKHKKKHTESGKSSSKKSKHTSSFKNKATKVDNSKLVSLGDITNDFPPKLDAETGYFSHNSHLRLYLYRKYGIYFEDLTSEGKK